MKRSIKASIMFLDDKFDKVSGVAYDLAAIASATSIADIGAANNYFSAKRLQSSVQAWQDKGLSFDECKIRLIEDYMEILSSAVSGVQVSSSSISNKPQLYKKVVSALESEGYDIVSDDPSRYDPAEDLYIKLNDVPFQDLVKVCKIIISLGAKNVSGQAFGGSWTGYALEWDDVKIKVSYNQADGSIVATFSVK